MTYQPPGHEPPSLPGGPEAAGFIPSAKLRPPRPPFDYGKLIKNTLSLVWSHKFLWFFGLFAVGSTTTLSWSGNISGDFSGDEDRAPAGAGQFPREVGDWISAHLTLIIAAVAVAILLGFLIWLWTIVCRGAVIGSVEDIQEGRPSGFGAAFSRGKQSFGRLLLLDLFLTAIGLGLIVVITAVIVFLVFMAVSLGSAGQTIAVIILVLAVLGITGLVAVSLGYFTWISMWFVIWVPITLLVIYATRAVVLDRSGPIDALRRGWRLMINTLVRTLLLFLLSTGMGIAASLVAVMVIGLTALPAIIAWVITGLSDWPIAGIAISVLVSFLPIAAILVVYALINTYFTAFWTDIYRQLKEQTKGMENKETLPGVATETPSY